jgi:hypothetical protein
VATITLGQVPRENVHLDEIAKIKEEGQKRSRVMETVSYLTDVHGPRLTASPLTRAAGEWTKQRLREWGLENVHDEAWGPFGRGWTLEGFSANMVQPNFSPLIAFPKAWSPSTPRSIRGVPVYLDVASESDLDKYRGKLHRAIVLFSPLRPVKAQFDPPARRQSDEALLALANAELAAQRNFRPPSPDGAGDAGPAGKPGGGSREQRSAMQLEARKWQLIYDEGAAVVVEPGRGDGGTVFVGAATLPQRGRSGTGGSGSRRSRPWEKDSPEIVPQTVMAVEHYNRVLRMLQKGTNVELEIDIASRYHENDLMSFNILGEIPGSDLKDEFVMLGGHFDSWHAGTGATDNAIGCAVALEAVRILKAIGVKPRRTIRIALWTGEEQGLLGSRAYVAEHFGRVVTPQSPDTGGPRSRNLPADRAGGDSTPTSQTTSRPSPAKDTETSHQPAGASPVPAPNSSPAAGPTPAAKPPATKYELKPDHAKLSAYFNLDNGTGKIRGIYLQGNEALRPVFRAWLAPFADLGASTVTPANTSGTDHLSFDSVGLPGFQFIQDPLEYSSRTHHSSMDVYERIQEEDVKQASIIMASFVFHAAMRDEKLARKPLAGEIVSDAAAKP